MNLDDIKQIAVQGDPHTLSLYLDVDNSKVENQAAQPAWRIYVKQAVNSFQGQMEAKGVLSAIQARIDDFLDSYRPTTRGLALFFTADAEQIYELPVSVTPGATFGKPVIAPLLWALDEYERYLIVMVDQEKARLITAYLGGTTIEDRIENDMESYDFGQKTLMPASSAVAGGHPLTQGSNREAYQDMINEHIMRFYREVVDHVQMLVKQYPGIRIVIGGAEESAHTVRRLMPEPLSDAIVNVMSLPMRLHESEILEQVLPEALQFEREQELKIVQQVIDFAKSGGRGALGHKAVDEALTMRRVEMLVLPWPADSEVKASELSTRAFESGGTVELVHGEAAEQLNEEGGVAARLYYSF